MSELLSSFLLMNTVNFLKKLYKFWSKFFKYRELEDSHLNFLFTHSAPSH